MCNVIASLIYARHFEYDDPNFVRLLKFLEDFMVDDSAFMLQVQD